MAYSCLINKNEIFQKYFAVSLLCLAIALGSYMIFEKGVITIDNSQTRNWLNTQIWAKQNTRIGDVFIVPPYMEGFRIESERTIYGNWSDGTLMFYNPAFGYEWFRRMKMLGVNNKSGLKEFNKLNEDNFIKIANELKGSNRDTYLVVPKGKDLSFTIAYENETFLVYKVVL
jgi:hypothetical protein